MHGKQYIETLMTLIHDARTHEHNILPLISPKFNLRKNAVFSELFYL